MWPLYMINGLFLSVDGSRDWFSLGITEWTVMVFLFASLLR